MSITAMLSVALLNIILLKYLHGFPLQIVAGLTADLRLDLLPLDKTHCDNAGNAA